MASSSSGDKHFNLRLSTKHSSVSFTQHLTVLFFCFSISHMLLYGDWLTGSKKRARWLQARRIFSPSCPNLRIPNRFLREGAESTRLTVTDGDLCQIIFFRRASCIISFVFPVPQDTVCHPPAVDIAVWQTAPTCTCLEATTQTLRRQAGPTTKTTLFSGSSGGFILRQPPGSRSAQRVTCPQSWPPCQVRTHSCLV